MVPLLHEQEIAGALIKQLEKLTYPKSLLDIVLVLEVADKITRATLARTDLPSWITVIEVPDADGMTTKPRALNYALDFCRGSIIGVWDAEDAPEPDQIKKVVTRFNEAPKMLCVCKAFWNITIRAKIRFPVVLQLNTQRGGGWFYPELQSWDWCCHSGGQHCFSNVGPLKN